MCFVLDSPWCTRTEPNNYGLLQLDDSSCHKPKARGMATPQPRSIDRIGPRPPAYTSFPTLLWPHRSPFCFSHMPSSFLPQSLCTCCPPTPRPSHGKPLLVTLVLSEMASLRMTTQPRIPSGPPIVLLPNPFDCLHSIRALKLALLIYILIS